jgi:uncharacterized membrane protein YraQ (UPF0718 family)
MKANKALKQTAGAIIMSFPTLVGVLLLTSFAVVVVPHDFYTRIFIDNNFVDSFIGAVVGSVAAGNPMTSYIFSGEMMERGVGMVAITAFLVTWVTVGVVQLPAEIEMLGKRYTLIRNGVAFASAIIIALITVFIMQFV